MSKRTLSMTDALYAYLLEASSREPPVLRALREETAKMSEAGMQISPEQGQFMSLLVEMLGATRILEIGTFTGYSSIAMAFGMPPGGRILCCDLSETYTAVARRFWEKAGVADRIELRLGPAVDTLRSLLGEGRAGSFDFAFIDADKSNYRNYYELVLQLLRPGGVLSVDNVLWNGAVADPARTDADTTAIRALNAHMKSDERVSLSLVPIGDGLTLARKRL